MAPDGNADGYAAERWFLEHGLPAVLTPAVRLRRLWIRSAPALAALAVVAANSLMIVAISGTHTVDIAGRPDLSESVVLGLLVVVVPVAALVGWLVARIESAARRRVAVLCSLAVIACGAVLGGPSPRVAVNIVVFGAATAGILALTAAGVGAILGWVAELTLTNVASAASMFVRALPVVLLTFLVFFNTYVWLMTSLISRGRLWLGIGFLLFVAGSFLVSTTLDQVRPMVRADTGPADPPLSVGERLNIVFVVAASQLVHVLTVAMLTGTVFFVLGLILVSPPVLDAWTRGNGRPDGELLGMTLPIPDALIQTSMLLTAITFMYLSAKVVSDGQYRAQFLDPMIDELRHTLTVRNRYRAAQ